MIFSNSYAKSFCAWVLVFPLVSLCTLSAYAKQYDPDIAQLVGIVEKCVVKEDTRHELFHGCVDWHSSVHGHWALLWGAHLLNDENLSNWVLSRFEPNALKKELDSLRDKDKWGRTFEMPYGRAWLLQLATDAEKLYGFQELRPLADYCYDSMLVYARNQGGNIEASDYSNASWYLYQLLNWARFNNYKKNEEEILEIISNRYTKEINWPDFRNVHGFFDPTALAALLLSTTNDNKAWSNVLENYATEDLTPIVPPYRLAHQGGLNFSRSWGLWAIANKSNEYRFRIAAKAHRDTMLNNIDYWANDYRRFGHWVAQFGLFSYRIELSP